MISELLFYILNAGYKVGVCEKYYCIEQYVVII